MFASWSINCHQIIINSTIQQKGIMQLPNQVTIFGDIHANLPALEAVFRDIETRNLNNLYCLGDLVGYGTFPNEVVELIRGVSIPTLMGNYDQGVGNDSDDCGCAYKTDVDRKRGELSIAWSNAHTTEENKAFLRSLPASIPLQLGDLQVLLVHGSPRKVNEYMFEDRPDDYFERLLDTAQVDILVCGHTHLPYHKVLPSGRQIVNAGSVGKPKDHDARACYMELTANRRDLKVDFIRVPYDVERTASAIEATPEQGGMPHRFAQMLRDGAG
jgi:predicted phosphodiesterase